MKRLIFFLLALGFTAVGSAQVSGAQYTDLFDLFSIEKYKKCAKDAKGYTEDEDTENEAEPYLWVSMANYKMAEMVREKGKNDSANVMEALIYAGKFSRRDKGKKMYKAHNWYFVELSDKAVGDAGKLVKRKRWGAAADIFSGLHRMDKSNQGYRLLMAMSYDMDGFKSKGRKDAEDAMTKLKGAVEADPNARVPKQIQELLSSVIIEYTDYLYQAERFDESIATITMAKAFMAYDKRVVGKYNIMTN